MHSEYTDSQYIEDYLRNELTPNEKLQFESRLKSDASFNLIYKRHLGFEEVLKENHNRKVKGFLKNIESQSGVTDNVSSSIKGNSRKNRLLGLLLMALGLICLFVFQQKKNASVPQNVFAEYYKPYPNTLVKIERGENAISDLHTAMLNYSNQEYNKSILAFDKILQDDESNDAVRFYKAVSLLETGESQKAITILKQLKNQTGFDMIPEVRWYLSLAHLKNEDQKSALVILDELVESKQVYQKTNAEKLLKLLSQ